jgi:acyl-phosphate glycerol 3-phosphate acyltransferase
MGTSDSGNIALVIVIGYLLGAIPFGLILTKMFGAGDLRSIGSGNIGATNVLRTGRKGLAAATLLLDMAKGAAAVCIARMIVPELALIGGFAAFLGHCYPVWLKFNGGKGVATMLGISLAWRTGALAHVVGRWDGGGGCNARCHMGHLRLASGENAWADGGHRAVEAPRKYIADSGGQRT